MASFPFDGVIFDLDGTLADTAPDLAAALNHVLAQMGRSRVPAASVQRLIGHGARALLRRGLAATGEADEDLVEQGFPRFIDYYADNICRGTTIYPGLETALDQLKARGVGIAICTNKQEMLTFRLLDALGWSSRFDAVVCGDTLPVRKPDPAPLHEAVARLRSRRPAFVGDSITDADTARAARLPFVAVSFGFSDRPVEALGADVVIDGYEALIPALERLAHPSQAETSR